MKPVTSKTKLRNAILGLGSCLIWIGSILLATLASISGNAFTFEEVGGQVVIEAESFETRTAKEDGNHWAVLTEGNLEDCTYRNSRNGMFIKTLPDTGSNHNTPDLALGPPSADYKVNITTPGTYRLWLLWGGFDGSADTVYGRILEVASPGWYRYAQDNGGDFSIGWAWDCKA